MNASFGIKVLAAGALAPFLINTATAQSWVFTGTSSIWPSATSYNVGIGQFAGTANTPQRLLHVWSTGANQIRLQDQNGSWDLGGGGDFHIIQNSSGSDIFAYYTVSNYIRIGPSAQIYLDVANNRVGIGNTSPAYALDVTGSVHCTGSFVTSDARWKKDINPIDNALDKVLRLRGVTYQFRSDELPEMKFPEGKQVGFIAQEVESVLPEVVNTDDRGYKAVAYQNITALLVEATKQQQSTIAKQQSTIADQQATIADLSARLTRLEALVKGPSLGTSSVGAGSGAVAAAGIQLDQNRPNPSDGSTTISYFLPESIAGADLVINEAATGREIYRAALTQHGKASVVIGDGKLSAGSYVYSVVVNGTVAQSRTMVVVH